jgi:hypothetical protein
MLNTIITLVPSAARTTSGNGDWLDLEAISKAPAGNYLFVLRFQVNVTAVSGTSPSLTVFLEDCVDGANNANSVAASAAISTVSRVILTSGPRGDAYPTNFAWPFNASRARIRWAISGTTPSFTFDVKGVLL